MFNFHHCYPNVTASESCLTFTSAFTRPRVGFQGEINPTMLYFLSVFLQPKKKQGRTESLTTTGGEDWTVSKSTTGLGIYQALQNIPNRSIDQQSWAPDLSLIVLSGFV
jgi:hypothetical protein